MVVIGAGPPEINGRKRVGHANIFVKEGVGHAKILTFVFFNTE